MASTTAMGFRVERQIARKDPQPTAADWSKELDCGRMKWIKNGEFVGISDKPR